MTYHELIDYTTQNTSIKIDIFNIKRLYMCVIFNK